SLFELEDGAHPRQLLGRGGYELHRAVPYRRLVALEEGAARVSLPRREAPKRLSALFRRTPPRRGVPRVAEPAQHSGGIAQGRVLADALLQAARGLALEVQHHESIGGLEDLTEMKVSVTPDLVGASAAEKAHVRHRRIDAASRAPQRLADHVEPGRRGG